MKKIIFLTLITFQLKGQVYQPLSLNNTSYWVHDFHYYSGSGPQDCTSKFVSYVEKDTLINSKQYWKIQGYFSEPITGWNCGNGSFWIHPWICFIREDTVLKKVYGIYGSSEELLIDFDKQLGDTISAPGNGGSAGIDSITYNTINGITRRFQWSKVNFNYNYTTIEGVGTSHSFPFSGYGEWGIPMFTLICYSKNGISLYPDSTISKCDKLNPLSTVEQNFIDSILSIAGNDIIINNSSSEYIEIRLYSLEGKNLFQTRYGRGRFKQTVRDFAPGIYILHGENKGHITNMKMIVR